MIEIDLSTLQETVVRSFTDSVATGEDWTRLRQDGPAAPSSTGRMVTPAATELAFRAFVPGLSKATVKDKTGERQDETIAVYTCKTQVANGLTEDIDFTAADETLGRRGDTLRRERDGKHYEVQVAGDWAPGGFWALTCKQLQGVPNG